MATLGETAVPKFLAVDFYCGAGGTTRGLLDAGGYVIAGIDKDESCRDTYCRNNRNETLDRRAPEFLAMDMFPASPEFPEGQQDLIQDALDDLIRRRRDTALDMAIGTLPLLFAICAPCQSFTKFVQRNMTDERAEERDRDLDLLSQALPFIERHKPEMILSENVASIERGRHSHIWKDFQSKLRDMGYRVGGGVVDARRFGIAQRRRRSIILAVKAMSDSPFDLLIPSEDGEAPNLTVSEVIGSLPPLNAGEKCDSVPNHECRNLTDINRRRLDSVAPGEPNFGFPEELALPCHRRLEDKGRRGFGDVYTRIRPDRPAPTITTRFHSVSNGRFGHYDENQTRGLSVREGALLQSFPENYEFYATGMDAAARMIGNAVPPKLAERMARNLGDLWAKENSIAGCETERAR